MTQNNNVAQPAQAENQLITEQLKQLEELIRTDQEHQFRRTWLTGEQVMDLLSISRRTLQKYRDEGLLGFSAIGKKFYYRLDEIRACLERHYQPPFALRG